MGIRHREAEGRDTEKQREGRSRQKAQPRQTAGILPVSLPLPLRSQLKQHLFRGASCSLTDVRPLRPVPSAKAAYSPPCTSDHLTRLFIIYLPARFPQGMDNVCPVYCSVPESSTVHMSTI